MKKAGITLVILACILALSVSVWKRRPIFPTEAVTGVTFFAYGGAGTGSRVPPEDLKEILRWLDSFTVGPMVFGSIPPGTNTIWVAISYSDGTVLRAGLDTVEFMGLTHYTRSGRAPECFDEILFQADFPKEESP